MKYFFTRFTITWAALFLFVSSEAQMKRMMLKKDTTPVYKNFVLEYNKSITRSKTPIEVAGTTQPAKKDSVAPEIKYATFFVQKKVYPNTDALELVKSLNPSIKDNTMIDEKMNLITPKYPKLRRRVQRKFDLEFIEAKKPSSSLNQAFLAATQLFDQLNQKIQTLEGAPGKLTDIKDSLSLLQYHVWPRINDSSGIISQIQMGYYLKEINALNQLMRASLDEHPVSIVHIEQLLEITEEVFDATGIYIPRKKRPGIIGFTNSNVFPLSYAFPFAVNYPGRNRQAPAGVAGNEIQCNVYIFALGDDGKAKPDPEMGAYTIWYGPPGCLNILSPGCDTSAFFTGGKDFIASTFPAKLGQGQYVFIYTNIRTGVTKLSSIIRRNELAWDNNETLLFTIKDF